MRILLQHRSLYRYPKPAALGPHVIRLRPADHAKARIETYGLRITDGKQADGKQADGQSAGEPMLHWQRDPAGNHIARLTWRKDQLVEVLDVLVELTVDIRPVNPFDFYLDEYARHIGFAYPDSLRLALLPYLQTDDAAFATGSRFETFWKTIAPKPGSEQDTVGWLVSLCSATTGNVNYVIREETGTWTPEETLTQGRGSCRDSAALLVAAMRRAGLAARFVSGYLVQLRDEGMLPDEPRGVDRDVLDLHAWAEVYLPGAGWIGLDGTSGLFCGEGHIPLACTATPSAAAPVEGTADQTAASVEFETRVGRVGHDVSVTTPYTETTWQALTRSAAANDARLEADGLTLTVGGEPTFNARENADAPEWCGEALGPDKWAHGLTLAAALRRTMAPGSALLLRQGKHYPGESLPRWALDLLWRADGVPLWPDRDTPTVPSEALAQEVAHWIAEHIHLQDAVMPAYEDPWHFLREEALLPVDVDPLQADLDDSEDRRRLARVLDRGLGTPTGWVLPVNRIGGRWVGGRWALRRAHLFLLPGDSPLGLRLPLQSVAAGWLPAPSPEPDLLNRDPRRGGDDDEQMTLPVGPAWVPGMPVRTALCIEYRDGAITAFLPPVGQESDFIALIGLVDAARAHFEVDIRLTGYGPPRGQLLDHFAVTPDPGVLEVNIPPTRSTAGYAETIDRVFDAALGTGLHSEKYLLDGRQQGSGGGNHITLGGPSLLESPWIQRPDLLASLVTFVQHHPSLSYLFTGLFVGPTSQAPRVDEARHEALYELDLALDRAHSANAPPPWLSDMLLRHLLVDVSGNTHRAEICLDKLCDPNTQHGRQGLVELRAFEMPPHPRMAVAQVALVRALVAGFARRPYRAPLIRFGQSLHDRYLLPYFLWRDFDEILTWLDSAGVGLPAEAYRPFLELRCPVVGEIVAEGVKLTVRNALEPWNVLGEEPAGGGTSRFVDSSMERVEVRVSGLQPGRHAVLVNGLQIPLHPADGAGDYVAGVRFRAWAPAHSLHPHIGIHHPLHFDLVDLPAQRGIGAGAYHVWHPEGRAYDSPPLTRFEAGARRAQRFTVAGPLPWPVTPRPASPHPDAPISLDLRRFPIDRPMPRPEPAEA